MDNIPFDYRTLDDKQGFIISLPEFKVAGRELGGEFRVSRPNVSRPDWLALPETIVLPQTVSLGTGHNRSRDAKKRRTAMMQINHEIMYSQFEQCHETSEGNDRPTNVVENGESSENLKVTDRASSEGVELQCKEVATGFPSPPMKQGLDLAPTISTDLTIGETVAVRPPPPPTPPSTKLAPSPITREVHTKDATGRDCNARAVDGPIRNTAS